MITGEEAPDDGDVTVPKKLTIGYFRQDVEEMSGRSVLDEAIAGSGRARRRCITSSKRCSTRWPIPTRADEMDGMLTRFGEVQEEYEHLGGYALESQAREVLHGLGSTTSGSTAMSARSPADGRCASRWRACCSAGPTCC